jgi:hypothetical protein
VKPLLVLAVALTAAAQIPVTRDWKTNPAVVRIETDADIYAVGDAHSDFVRLTRLLHRTGILASEPHAPEEARWSAGKAVLVSTGDMIDKGPRALDVLRFYQILRTQARAAGGEVVVLAGNHEAEFLANPAAPKGADFQKQLRAAGINPTDVAACKTWVGDFLCSLSFAARVNDWFFSHAGRTNGRTLDRLDSDLREGVEHDGFRTAALQDLDSPLQGRPSPEDVQWFDSGLPALDELHLLETWEKALGAAHIVQGHEPSEIHFASGVVRQRGQMFQRYGRIFLIDTGMSEGVNDSEGTMLHIAQQGREAIAVCGVGGETKIWDAETNPPLGRAPVCGRDAEKPVQAADQRR